MIQIAKTSLSKSQDQLWRDFPSIISHITKTKNNKTWKQIALSSVLVPPVTSLPLDDENRNDGKGNHHGNANAGSLAVARSGEQLGEPEGSDEAPDLTNLHKRRDVSI